MHIERHCSDLLILGSGGAGLLAALHAKQTNPDAEGHGGGQGPARQVRLHAHGAGGLQRRTGAGGFRRAPLHGHHHRRQVAAAAGSRMAAGRRRGRAHPGAGERDRLLLRPQPGRDHPPEGICGPELRPHRAQGRPHRHRDRQPGDGAGARARRAGAGGTPRDRADPGPRRLGRRRCAADRRAHRRIPLRGRQGGAAGDRRRSHDVPLPHPLRRQVLRRDGDGVARRPGPARHGDGAVPPYRAARGARDPHDRHGAGGRVARGRRPPAERCRRALHGAHRSGRGARHPGRGEPCDLRGDARRAHHADGRGVHRDVPPRALGTSPSGSPGW